MYSLKQPASVSMAEILADVGDQPKFLPWADLDWPVVEVVDGSVPAGFPSLAAEDFGGKRLDLIERLVTNPLSTYLVRARGHSMVEAGINDNDVLVVDRSIKARHGHIVLAVIEGEFTVKYLHERAGRVKLKAANPTYPDIIPKAGQEVLVWGVVKAALKEFRV